MKKTLLILAALVASLAPMQSKAAVRGFVVVGRPAFGGYYGPGWGYPYYGYGYYPAYPSGGEVKLETKVKDAEVFVNGAFAGTTKDNKTMHMRPGSYNIEIREQGQTRFTERVYVVAGKTLHLHPEL